VNPLANSCFWPRAFVALWPMPESVGHPALRHWLSQQDSACSCLQQDCVIVDVTHLQSTAGSPHEIASGLQLLLNQGEHAATAIGVADDPIIAAFAARQAAASGIMAIAPWETQRHVDATSIAQLLGDKAGLARELRRAGIRTGGELAAVPGQVVQHLFAEPGLALWRACRGVSNASAPEISCRYNGVHCRVVLPPRTSSLRSVSSHVRRISGAFINALQRIQRHTRQIEFVVRIDNQPIAFGTRVQLDISETRVVDLALLLVAAMKQSWNGASVTHLELSADNLLAPGGQLDMFSGI
jgi:nucleotidyltransferase/DNA polymerase involved in DNA repair